MPPWDSWHPMWWFPVFPILFLLCLVIFLLVMVPMMIRRGPWRERDREDFPRRTALDVLNER